VLVFELNWKLRVFRIGLRFVVVVEVAVLDDKEVSIDFSTWKLIFVSWQLFFVYN
jgi:hypothetical protein